MVQQIVLKNINAKNSKNIVFEKFSAKNTKNFRLKFLVLKILVLKNVELIIVLKIQKNSC